MLFVGLLAKAQSPKGTLTFNVGNFSDNSGQAVINLYRKESIIPKNPFLQGTCKIVNGKGTITFKDIPYREYAAILFHDKNSNKVIDHGMFGPSEPMGFPNGYKMSHSSGSPSFKKLKFTFSKEKSVYTINIQ